MELIDGDSGAGKPFRGALPNAAVGSIATTCTASPPLQGTGEEPAPDTLVVTAVDHAKDLPAPGPRVVSNGSMRVQALITVSWK